MAAGDPLRRSTYVSALPEIHLASGDARAPAALLSNGSVVQRLNPAECDGWDAMLLAHPGHSFFQSAAWAKVLQDSYGYTPGYFALTEAGQLRALLPMMEVNSWLTGRRGISLPFTDDCAPLSFDFASFQQLIEAAKRWGQARNWKYLEVRGGRQLFPGALASHSFFAHELKLVNDEPYLLARLDSAVRRAIRKAEKLGVTVEVAQSLEALRLFYSLHCQTRKKHGLPPQPFRFFRNIHRHVLSRQNGMVVLARLQERVVAAGVYFHFGARAIYKYGASNEACQDLRGNNLVMWEAIKWYARHGFETLHFGRTSAASEGLRRFKLGWGVRERRIDYVRYDLRQRSFVSGKDGAFGWYNRLFHVLPVGLSRLVGAVLYRHVA